MVDIKAINVIMRLIKNTLYIFLEELKYIVHILGRIEILYIYIYFLKTNFLAK